MKTLIVYASKYGCAADCAAYLKSRLPGGAALADANGSRGQIELEKFDAVVVGGSVYVGMVSKKLRAFCAGNIAALLGKQVGVFLCCAQPGQAGGFFSANFPPELLESAKTTGAFGGEARLEKMGFFDRALLRIVTKGDYSGFKVSRESMESFAEAMAR